MKKILILVLYSCIFVPSFLFGKPHMIDWPEWETPYSGSEKEKMISEIAAGPGSTGNDISEYHFIDLNRDNLEDIVFNGNVGGESDVCSIFLNDGKGYRNVLYAAGHVTKLVKDPDSNYLSVEIDNYPCCDGFIGFICLYEFDDEKSEYQVVSRDLYYSYITRWPGEYLKEGIGFSVSSSGAEMLAQPLITNNSLAPTSEDDVLKNRLFLLSENASGQILATYNSDGGEKFYFAKVDFSYVTEKLNPFYYHHKDAVKLSALGWIRSQEVNLFD